MVAGIAGCPLSLHVSLGLGLVSGVGTGVWGSRLVAAAELLQDARLGWARPGCRMSCKLAQLIYFNTNLTLIVCCLSARSSLHFIPSAFYIIFLTPRLHLTPIGCACVCVCRFSICIVKILSLPYLNMAIAYKDLPYVVVVALVRAAARRRIHRCRRQRLSTPSLMLRHSFLHSPLVRGCSQR